MSLLTYLQYVPLNVPAVQNDRRCCPLAVVPNSVNEFQEIRSLVWNICNGTRRLKYELDGQNPGKPRKGEGGSGWGHSRVSGVGKWHPPPFFYTKSWIRPRMAILRAFLFPSREDRKTGERAARGNRFLCDPPWTVSQDKESLMRNL